MRDPAPYLNPSVACRSSRARRRPPGRHIPKHVDGAEVADDGKVVLHVSAQHQLNHELHRKGTASEGVIMYSYAVIFGSYILAQR